MKAILLSVIALLVMSCSPFGLNPMGYEVKHEDLDTAWRKVSAMKYIPEEIEHIKSPSEFFRDEGGDCDDFAIALMYLLGPKSEFVCVREDAGLHIIVYYNGEYLEPQIHGMTYPIDSIVVVFTLDFDNAMMLATRAGNKTL